jgi:hypothetical protein
MLASPLAAQATSESAMAADLAALRAELTRLRGEVGALRSEVAVLRDAAGPDRRMLAPGWRSAVYTSERTAETAAPAAVQPAAVTPEALELIRAQVEELAQSKVESSSRLPVKLSGTVLANTFVNSGEANWLDNPNLVAPPAPGAISRGSMSATARQSRIGLAIGGIPVGTWQATGTLIVDFFGGVPNFQTGTVMGLPRLIYGFGRIENDRTAIQVGQDHVLLAPREPTSLAALAFPLLFRSGNLYLRAPQARVEQKVGGWTLAGGIVAPIAGDFVTPYEFAPVAGAGERSKRPAAEARVGFARGDGDTAGEGSFGVSGHYGWRRQGDNLNEAWAVAVDGNARAGRVGVAGEAFVAENAEPFGGGISQAGRAAGGWLEGRFALTRRTNVIAGVGIDRPEDAVGRLIRSENRSAFSSVIFRFTPEVAASVEYRWLETSVGLVPVRRTNHHVNGVFAVSF